MSSVLTVPDKPVLSIWWFGLSQAECILTLSLLDDAVWRGSPHPTLKAPHPPLFAVTVLMAFDQFAPVTSGQDLRTPELQIAMSRDEIGWLAGLDSGGLIMMGYCKEQDTEPAGKVTEVAPERFRFGSSGYFPCNCKRLSLQSILALQYGNYGTPVR